MEDSKAVVLLDISSDEDSDNGCGGDGDVDLQWIRKLLDEEDDESFNGGGDSEDSDDVVVVVSEVCGDRKQSVKKADGGGESDDDDCVVLDGDPDKPRGVEKEKGGFEDGDGDDDLVVVSEKGEVACRDFPHPRHLCAKFPFSSSRHEMHCDQCHCYVCDSLAPCVDWGTGVSSVDHCHATDKDTCWKAQRSCLKKVELPGPIPVPAAHPIAISMRTPMADQSSPLVPNLVPQNHILKRFTVRPCSTPTNSVVPNVTRQIPHPGYLVPRSKYQTHLISQRFPGTSPHVSLTDRRQNNSNLGPQLPKFKRIAGSAFSSGRSVRSPSCLNYGSQLPTDSRPAPRWQGSHGRITSATHAYQSSYLSNVGEMADMLSPQTDPILGNRFSNTMPPPQLLSQQNRGTGNGNGILLQPQMEAQQHISPGYTDYMPQTSSHCPVDDLSVNSVPPQQPVSSRTLGIGNIRDSFVSGPQTTYQRDMGYGCMNTTPTAHQLTLFNGQNDCRTIGYSEPAQYQSFRQSESGTECLPPPLSNAGSSFIDRFLPYQSPEYNQPTIIPNSHDTLQQGNQTILEGASSNVAVSDSCPMSCTTPGTQLSGYNPRLQNEEQIDYNSENTNFYPQYSSPTAFGTSDLEAWLSADQSVPNALGISVPLLNTPIPSPELTSLDGGGLFID